MTNTLRFAAAFAAALFLCAFVGGDATAAAGALAGDPSTALAAAPLFALSSYKRLPAVDITGTAITIKVPTGPTYDKIQLKPTGTGYALAELENIRVILNGKVVQEYASGVELDDVNKYHGRDAAGANDVTLYFRRPELVTAGRLSNGQRALAEIDAERVTSLRTRNLSTVTIEATADTGTWTAPAMTAFAEESPFPGEPLGLLTKVKRFTYNPGASGDFEIQDWPRGPRIIAVHFKKSDVDTVTLKANGFAVVDLLTKTALQEFQDQEARVPASGYTVVDFCANGNLDEALKTAGLTDLRATVNLGSSGALPVLIEYLDSFEGL